MNGNRIFAGLLLTMIGLAQQGAEPWTANEILEPATLAADLTGPKKPAKIIAVPFPFLYRQRHITGAVFAGPGNKAEGIEALKKEVAGLSKDAGIVLYCGCCPMDKCPNIRPAYKALKDLGYKRIRVLNIPENMHNDWYTKNYPSEPPVGN
jgi:thiosulfate/3-mercaptopyruvate sulfurtransferase